eukprot:TRINITY_DN713_c0_g1_i8.p1 TRINITY_DN713_c0_g1~~TRINITY_DN713_c0_g1_i8.p1  ORF type:complete len:1472 (+),score=330.39 TRINITY_DN713_c0_g1_i8:82-4416(+)
MGTEQAVQFHVTFSPTVAGGYRAIGFRPTGALTKMQGLDLYALDDAGSVTDFKVPDAQTGGTPAPPRDASNDAVYVGKAGTTHTFYRKLNTGDANDFQFTVGAAFTSAWALGTGSATAGNWAQHTKVGTLDVTMAACPVAPVPFVSSCAARPLLTGADMQVTYELGQMGADAAVQFAVTFAPTAPGGYGALAFRAAAGGLKKMQGLDLYALDDAGSVLDFKVPDAQIGGTPAPPRDASNDAVYVGKAGTTHTFYRKLNTGDANDFQFTVGAAFTSAWAVGPGSPTKGSWQTHTKVGSLDVTMDACPAMTPAPLPFVSDCGIRPLVTPDKFSVSYELGTVGAERAVQFHVTFSPTVAGGYGAMGFRSTGALTKMQGLDVYALDDAGSVTDFKVPDTVETGKPTKDASQDAVYVSRSASTHVFYRKLDTGDANDLKLTLGAAVTAAWALGGGRADADTWVGHATDRGTFDMTLEECPAVTPAPTPFVSACGLRTLATGDVSVSYELGTVGTEQAVQFHVTFDPTSAGGYGAIGFRPTGALTKMQGLDVYALDDAGSVTDFKVPDTVETGKPTKDASQDAVYVSKTGKKHTFYRKLDTGDTNDLKLTLGTAVTAAWARGDASAAAEQWAGHATNRGTFDMTLAECPAVTPAPTPFVSSCAIRNLVSGDVSVSYELGTVGPDEAVQFHVTFSPTVAGGYGAIGFRPTGALTKMQGLDLYALDDAGSVTDFKVLDADLGKMPTNDGVQDAVFVSKEGTTHIFYRKLNTGDPNDLKFTLDTDVSVAWALGEGSAREGTWKQHTKQGVADVTGGLKTCPSTTPPDTFVPCPSMTPKTLTFDSRLQATLVVGTMNNIDYVQTTVLLTTAMDEWAAIGFSATTALKMNGLSSVACSTDGTTVSSFSPTAGAVNGKPTRDMSNADTVSQSVEFAAGKLTCVFLRRMYDTAPMTPETFPPVFAESFALAYAYGVGTVDSETTVGSWSTKHVAQGRLEMKFEKCSDAPTPPPGFVSKCGPHAVNSAAGDAVQIEYELGTLGGDPAAQFSVTFQGTDTWAGIAYSAEGTTGMTGLDFVAFDTASPSRVVDFDLGTQDGAPQITAAATSTLTGHTTGASNKVMFARLLDTASVQDFKLEMGSKVRVGWALGAGKADAIAAKHSQAGAKLITLETCDIAPTPGVTPVPAVGATQAVFESCEQVDGGVSTTELLYDTTDLKITYQVGLVKNTEKDAVLFTVKMKFDQATDGWVGLGLRPSASGITGGMTGLQVYAAGTESGVHTSERVTANGMPLLSSDQSGLYSKGATVANGQITMEFFRELRSTNSHDIAENSWYISYAKGTGGVYSTWTKHTTVGMVSKVVSFSGPARCAIAFAAESKSTDKEDDDSGLGIGVIIAIIAGALLLCALLVGAFLWKRRQSDSLDYAEFCRYMEEDDAFQQDLDTVMMPPAESSKPMDL